MADVWVEWKVVPLDFLRVALMAGSSDGGKVGSSVARSVARMVD